MKILNSLRKYHQVIIPNRCVLFSIQFFILMSFIFLVSCSEPIEPVTISEETEVKTELRDRSFRQFEPDRDADQRKAIIIDFLGDSEGNIIRIWAQYAEDRNALKEWEIVAKDYKVEKGGAEHRLYFVAPHSRQNTPSECDDCIETEGVSISIRNLYDKDKIQFMINDDNGGLPAPFPVFNSWTDFNEDEIFQ